jgi:Chaperone of endosialidase
MSLNFPTSPVNNQIYLDSVSGNRYKYDAVNNVWFYTANNVLGAGLTSNTQVIYDINGGVGGSYGLTFNQGANTLTANTINAYSMRVTGNLYIGSNTVTISNNSIYADAIFVNGSAIPTGDVANSVYDLVNSAFSVANSAYDAQNTDWSMSNAAYTVANASFGHSNATYAAVNSAFGVINAAYGMANGNYTVSNSSFDKLNSAFTVLNASYTMANANYVVTNSAYTMANMNYTVTNAAYVSVNSAYTVVNSAYTFANVSVISANSWANQVALSANSWANTVALSANGWANTVAISANSWANTVALSANGWANTVGLSANGWANTVALSANGWANTVALSANGWANTVAISANNYSGYMANSANGYANNTFVKLNNGTQTITGDIAITGNLNVMGSKTYTNTTNFVTADPLIYLAANNNVSDVVDIGFVAHYTNATSSPVHTGFYRSAGNKEYYLFNGYDWEPELSNNIDPYSHNMVNAVLNADFVTSNLTLGGANSIVWIKSAYDNSNGAFGVTNATYAAVNSAFGVINAAFASANNVAPQVAPAYNTANGAYGLANANFTRLSAAYVVANAAFGLANTSLTTSNYNSYAPTLTGTGASGSWGINVTGSSASAPLLSALSTYTWSASTTPSSYSLGIQSSFVSSSQGFQSYGSVMTMNTYSGGGGALQLYVPYSPTYGGTGIQVRFGNYDVSGGNSWTSWKTLLASDNYSSYALPLSGGTVTGSTVISTGTNMPLKLTTSSSGPWALDLYRSDVDNHCLVYNAGGYWYFNNYIQSASSVRGNIFYDSDNTGYYVDPTSYSQFSAVMADNWFRPQGLTGVYSQSYGQHFYAHSGGSYWVLGANSKGYGGFQLRDSYEGTAKGYYYWDGAGFGILNDQGGWSVRCYYGSGYGGYLTGSWTSSSDHRAPIFYDVDNTGYYADPASTTRLNVMYADIIRSSDNWWLDGGGNARMLWVTSSHSYYRTCNSHVFRNSANNDTHYLAGDGNIFTALWGDWVSNQWRSPIFYDYNDTGYYCDPNSVSRFSTININYLRGSTTRYSMYDSSNNLLATPSGIEYNSGSFIHFTAGSSAIAPYSSYRSSGDWPPPYGIGWGNLGESCGVFPRFSSNGSSLGELIFHTSNDGYGSFAWRRGTWEGTSYNGSGSNHYGQLLASIDWGGNFVAIGNITAYYSDKRLKTDIKPIENAIDKLKQISGITYRNNELAKSFGYKDEEEQVGVLAQDVEKVMPQVVKLAPFDMADTEGSGKSKTGENYKTVMYDRLVPLLIEAIKEQQKQIDELKRQISNT